MSFSAEFFNSDGANHGVTASCSEPKNCFNVITPPGQGYKHRFVASKGPVSLGCPLHAEMAGWVFVFEHLFFAVTSADGKFRLPPLPPGTYRLRVRHPSGGMNRSLELVVKEGQPQSLKIEFGKDDLKAGP